MTTADVKNALLTFGRSRPADRLHGTPPVGEQRLDDHGHGRLAADSVAVPLGHDTGMRAREHDPRVAHLAIALRRELRDPGMDVLAAHGHVERNARTGFALLARATAASTYALTPSFAGDTGTRTSSIVTTSGERAATFTAASAAAGVSPPTWTPPI